MMPVSLPIIARDYEISYRRQRHGRRFAAPFGEEVGLFSFCRHEMARLYMTEAANFFRNAGECHGDRVFLRREPRQNFLDHRLVVGDELAFGAALFAVAENIERRAA